LTDAKEGLLTGISGIWQKQYMKVCVSDRGRTGVVQSVQWLYFGLLTGEQWIDSRQGLKFFCSRQSRPALESTHSRIQREKE